MLSSRIKLKETIKINKNLNLEIKTFLEQEKTTIIEYSNSIIIAKEGSQFLTRLLGGWFVPAKWLPKKITIIFKELEIDFLIEETLGFGILDSFFREKYKKSFQDFLTKFKTKIL
jgi:hypothetical protein